jgi:cytochrome c551/c552
MRMTPTAALTLAFGLCAALTGIHTIPAAFGKTAAKTMKKPAASGAAQIALGKGIAEENGCNSCHAATYAGKKGFSPSIRANGITAKYTLAHWERVMNTGVTEDGGHVNKPMPVYHMPAAKSAPLYAFVKSLK